MQWTQIPKTRKQISISIVIAIPYPIQLFAKINANLPSIDQFGSGSMEIRSNTTRRGVFMAFTSVSDSVDARRELNFFHGDSQNQRLPHHAIGDRKCNGGGGGSSRPAPSELEAAAIHKGRFGDEMRLCINMEREYNQI